MFDYYQYFVDKGHHPNKDDILQQEKTYSFESFSHDDALNILNNIVKQARHMNKSVGIRIIYQQKVIVQYIMDEMDIDNALSWITRKENMVNIAHHSSYYAFLDNIDKHLYDQYIYDDHYALCGGSFPLIVNNEIVGTITVTGLRPYEDHGIIIEALKDKRRWK